MTDRIENEDGLYVDSLTDEALAKLRTMMVKAIPENIPDPDTYTCDDCDLAPRCPYVFDLYNTGGDCLLEK